MHETMPIEAFDATAILIDPKSRPSEKNNKARDLNIDEIPAPSVYWQQKGVIHKQKYTNLWEGKQIRNIMKNPIYIGDVLISKTQKCYYKGITTAVNRDDGYYVENHHEAIIDREMFNLAQEMMASKRKEYFSTRDKYDGIQNKKESLLRGILYCGHCGNKMNGFALMICMKQSLPRKSSGRCRR